MNKLQQELAKQITGSIVSEIKMYNGTDVALNTWYNDDRGEYHWIMIKRINNFQARFITIFYDGKLALDEHEIPIVYCSVQEAKAHYKKHSKLNNFQ